GIYLGSRRLKDFDPALVSYAGATVFAAFGLGYRYTMWLRRPPTRTYWRRSWQLFFSPKQLIPNIARLAALVWTNIVEQRFIRRRSLVRWSAHWFIFWGCILAAAVTFPLSFGWVRFETARDSEQIYNAYMFGIHAFSFRLDSLIAPLVFNILDIAAFLVLFGIFFALWRRGRDRGALVVQQFGVDLLPVSLLFAVCITGLSLTASTHFLRGFHYPFLSEFHAVTVIFTLLYLPFGKFFHIFQRPAQLGVGLYKQAGQRGEQAECIVCKQPFASKMHIEDLKAVQAALGIKYDLGDGAHYQSVCPECRRKNLGLTQDAIWRAAGQRGEFVPSEHS
ncbi:MAG: MFS transporter, partial [Blastocatellia bacterium]